MLTEEASLHKILRDVACHSLGIVPLNYRIHDGVQEKLNLLSPDEARRMKRKFRKLWRKIAKQKQLSTSVDLGESQPAKSKKRRRKNIVLHSIEEKFVQPTLKRMLKEETR